MSIIFNAAEVFQIGVTIEKNGRTFYIAAAKKAGNEDILTLFTELAEWEGQHVVLFESLAKELVSTDKDETVWDPDEEIGLYLKASADSHIFNQDSDPTALAASCRTSRDALKMAMNFEKDSVVFYSSMRAAVPENLGKGRVERLIHEELNHIAILARKMKEIG